MYLAGDAAAAAIAAALPAKIAVFYETNNGRGTAALGLDRFVLGEKTKALFIITETPEREEDLYADLMPNLEKLEMIVAVGSNATYLSDAATIVLPAADVNEYPGTVTSWEGRVQKVTCRSCSTGRRQMPVRNHQPAFWRKVRMGRQSSSLRRSCRSSSSICRHCL